MLLFRLPWQPERYSLVNSKNYMKKHVLVLWHIVNIYCRGGHADGRMTNKQQPPGPTKTFTFIVINQWEWIWFSVAKATLHSQMSVRLLVCQLPKPLNSLKSSPFIIHPSSFIIHPASFFIHPSFILPSFHNF